MLRDVKPCQKASRTRPNRYAGCRSERSIGRRCSGDHSRSNSLKPTATAGHSEQMMVERNGDEPRPVTPFRPEQAMVERRGEEPWRVRTFRLAQQWPVG